VEPKAFFVSILLYLRPQLFPAIVIAKNPAQPCTERLNAVKQAVSEICTYAQNPAQTLHRPCTTLHKTAYLNIAAHDHAE
jgi:hypothetical protein